MNTGGAFPGLLGDADQVGGTAVVLGPIWLNVELQGLDMVDVDIVAKRQDGHRFPVQRFRYTSRDQQDERNCVVYTAGPEHKILGFDYRVTVMRYVEPDKPVARWRNKWNNGDSFTGPVTINVPTVDDLKDPDVEILDRGET